MSERMLLMRRRGWAAIRAAFMISVPFLPLIIFYRSFGLVVWACLFVPALGGICFVQLPIKLFAERHGWAWRASFMAVLTGNVTATIAAFSLFGIGFSFSAVVVLVTVALIAAGVWYFLDDKALGDRTASYRQGYL